MATFPSSLPVAQNKKAVTKLAPKVTAPKKSAPIKPATPTIKAPTPAATQQGAISYTGNGGKFGELPKQDATGKWSWVDQNGQQQSQPGFDKSSGSWNYLNDSSKGGAPHTPSEWQAAQAFYTAHPNVQMSALPPDQRLAFIDQAHQELNGAFQNAVNQGRTDLINSLGNTLQTYSASMKDAGFKLSDDIAATQNALEGAGLTFTGEGIKQLGAPYAGSGVVTQDQLNTLQQNISNINQVTTGDVTQGNTNGAPTPTDVAQGNGTGQAGTGQYGINQNFNRFNNTGLTEGSVFRNNRTNYMESARNTLNSNVRDLGRSAEALLGSANVSGLNGPTIGGMGIYNPARGVFGSTQGTQQTNVGNRVGNLEGSYYGNNAYAFQV